MDKIAVLIPCYNEEATIEKVIRDWKAQLPEAVIYVYDNNCTDRTALLARQAGALVRREYSQGKGNVIRRMFREVDAACYIMVDGDDTYPAEYGPQMAEAVLNRQADMVVGDRLSTTYYQENKRPFHNFGNSLMKAAINFLFRSDIKDIMTGYRAFSYAFVKSFPVLSQGFEIETEMSIHAIDKKLRIENIAIAYRDRPEGSTSKLDTYADGRKIMSMLFRLFRTYRPMAYFGILALLLVLLSGGFFLPVLLDYWKTGLVERFPTLIVCGFVMIAALLSLFAGSILETLRQKDRQDFEMRLHQIQESKRPDAVPEEEA